jgi:hypothetical protein
VVVPGRDDVVVPRGTDVDARDVVDEDARVVDVDVDPGTVVADDDVDLGDVVVVVARAAEVGGATVAPLVACVEPAVPGLAAVAGRTRM